MTQSADVDSDLDDLPDLDDLSIELEAQRAIRKQKQEATSLAGPPDVKLEKPKSIPKKQTTDSLLGLEENASHPLNVAITNVSKFEVLMHATNLSVGIYSNMRQRLHNQLRRQVAAVCLQKDS